jgi:hypothetical protein
MFKILRLPAISRPFALVMLFSFLTMMNGCYYFKVNKSVIPPQDEIKKMQAEQKIILLHHDKKVMRFTGVTVNQDSVSGSVSSYNTYERSKPVKTEGANRYKKSGKSNELYLLNEVHIYINEYSETSENKISVPLKAIQKIEIYDKAKGATTASWVFSIGGTVTAVLLIISIIVLLTKSSCPFIYNYNGDSYAFAGEIYGGATYPSLERNDYMPLPAIKPAEGKFLLIISNELKERQYTDIADLLIIRHPKNSSVLLDKYGQIQTISEVQKPSSAISFSKYDFTNSVTEKDTSFFLFDESENSNSLNSLILTFNNQNNSDTGKLIINAKNSLWADYAYGKFFELFGTYYNKWNDKQKKVSSQKLTKRIMDQDIPLSVYLETSEGWKFVDFYNVVGPLGTRDMVMPINLSKAGSGEIRIKLETGFMFWELDYAGMDFSKNIPLEVTTLKPDSVVDNLGNDLTSLLSYDDKNYLEQMSVGDEAYVSYNIPEQILLNDKNEEQTVFLHTKGFYEAIREFKSKPDWHYLYSLRSPHSFSRFSYQEYERKFINNEFALTAK